MLTEGDALPEFSLQDAEGNNVTNEDLTGTVVVYFYPKDDTPGCTKEACSFRDNHKKLEEMDISVCGVSTDDFESHSEFSEKHNLPFTLLADPGAELAKAFGVFDSVHNGQTFASRKTFIIRDGEVIKVFEKVEPDNHVEEVLEYLNG